MKYNATQFPSVNGVPIADFTPVNSPAHAHALKHIHDGFNCVYMNGYAFVASLRTWWYSKKYSLTDLNAPNGAAIVGAEILARRGWNFGWIGQIWQKFMIWLNDAEVFSPDVDMADTDGNWKVYEGATALMLPSPINLSSTDIFEFGPWQQIWSNTIFGAWVHGAKVRLLIVKKFSLIVTAKDQNRNPLTNVPVDFIDPDTGLVVDTGTIIGGTLTKILLSATYTVKATYQGISKTQTVNLTADGQTVPFTFIVGELTPVQFFVQDQDTTQPIPDVTITIYQGGQPVQQGTTGVNGSFTFNLVINVAYTYSAAKTGYTTKTGAFTTPIASITVFLVPIPPPECTIDADCPSGYVCKNGVCVKAPPCFIATAAYGTPLAPQLQTLRSFRDRFLPDSIVVFYYATSPPIADLIRKSSKLRRLVRAWLSLFIRLLKT